MSHPSESSGSSDNKRPSVDGHDPEELLQSAVEAAKSSHPHTAGGAWEPPLPDAVSAMLPGYEVTDVLGRGGMGAVYKGIQSSLERQVAIKLLPPELGADPEFETRFRREAKAMARLNHPAIVQIYDFGVTDEGHHYFVMEFVDGTDLHRYIRSGELDAEGALNAVSQICDALEYAHTMGFVHRDIKPANIFINSAGMLKVGDFGLAKLVENDDDPSIGEQMGLTMTGVALGTPHYIAPEQMVEGASVDQRADIYSLGVMFYEMLTGEIPRGAVKAPSEKVSVKDEGKAIDVRIDGVVFKAMESDPDERYQSATDLRTDVDGIRMTPMECGGSPPLSLSDGENAHPQDLAADEGEGAATRARESQSGTKAPHSKAGAETEARGKKPGLVAAMVLLPLLLIGGLAFFLTRGGEESVDEQSGTDILPVSGGNHDRVSDHRTSTEGGLTGGTAATATANSEGLYANIRGSKWRSLANTGNAISFNTSGESDHSFILTGSKSKSGRATYQYQPVDDHSLAWAWSDGKKNEFRFTEDYRFLYWDEELFAYRYDLPLPLQLPLGEDSVAFYNTSRGGRDLPTTNDPTKATEEMPYENELGMRFVPVPISGGPTDGKRVLFSIWETRVRDYEWFANSAGRKWKPRDYHESPDHPAVNVSFADAEAFCSWLNEKYKIEGRRYQLPTDHDWSCAVGIGERENSAESPEAKNRQILDHFPWGADWPPTLGDGNLFGGEHGNAPEKHPIAGFTDGAKKNSATGIHRPNRFGLFDLAGNVQEWCADSWKPSLPEIKVLRGSSWFTETEENALFVSISTERTLGHGRWLGLPGGFGGGESWRECYCEI